MVKKYNKEATNNLWKMSWVKPEIIEEQNSSLTAPTQASVQAHLENGANPNEKGNGGKTFLSYAVDYGDKNDWKIRLGITQTLLNNGANPNLVDTEQISPLMEACTCKNNTPVISELLKHNANVNQKDNMGMSPLMYTLIGNARNEEKIEITKMLIAKGANVLLKDKEGKTAIDYALQSFPSKHPLVKILLQAERAQDRARRLNMSKARQRVLNAKKGIQY